MPTAVVCGSIEGMLRKREKGMTMNLTCPITFATGTGPWPGTRESAELLRLSPIIHSCPSGTVTGPKGACRADPASGR